MPMREKALAGLIAELAPSTGADPDYTTPEALRIQAMYASKEWRRLRVLQLKKQPLCEVCLQDEVVTEARICHHWVRHEGDAALFFDPEMLQSLCRPHLLVARHLKKERINGTCG
jgi:5-methylcytosine-specific restriction protein A